MDLNLEFPENGENDFDYVLSEECEVDGKVLFEKLWEESKNNIYPWDWMVDKEVIVENDVEKVLLVELTSKMTLGENENKRKFEDFDLIYQTQSSLSKKMCSLSQNYLDELNEIKKQLLVHQNGNEDIFHHLIQFLTQLSLAQIELASDQLQLSQLSEQILINFTHYLIDSSEFLSVNLMIILIRSLFYDKIKSLNQTPTQIFSSSLIKLSQKYPRSTFEGLCINLIDESKGLTEFEVDLLCCVLKESLPEDLQTQFFQKFFNRKKSFTEVELKLIQNFIDLKVPMTSETITALISSLDKVKTDFSTNLKFARLLQSIIKSHLNLIRENNLIQKVESIITNNNSILRKPLSNLLSR